MLLNYDFKMDDYPELSRWAQCNQRVLRRRRKLVESVREDNRITEADVGMMCFKGGGGGL